jgi:hypothetical protein
LLGRDETFVASNLLTSDTKPVPLNETLSPYAPHSAEVEVSEVGYQKERIHIFLSSPQLVLLASETAGGALVIRDRHPRAIVFFTGVTMPATERLSHRDSTTKLHPP